MAAIAPLVQHGADISGITASRPSNVEDGQLFYDTTINVLLVYDATAAAWGKAGTSVVQTVTPDDSDNSVNSILALVEHVDVGTVVNGVTDYIVLPALADVPVGHTITILCNAGGAFEMRTPAASAEEINSEDCDGTKEYLCTDTQVLKVIKISTAIGWMAHAFTAIGAVATAVVPD